jgi:metallo-beta-lactamase family protein
MDAHAATLTFLGGTGTVTGSRFLLEHPHGRLLLDCGLYQGERELRRRNWEPFPVPPDTIDDVVLSHCHLDHCGYLPALVRDGFRGPIWLTEGTGALAAIVLRDSGFLNERDADLAREGGWSKHSPPLPLYTAADADRAITHFRTVGYDTTTELPGTEQSSGSPRDGGPSDAVRFRMSRAGHVLGSASTVVEVGATSVLFSGDLGRADHPVLRARAAPPAAHTVVVESTYGDRAHPRPDGPGHEAFADAIRRTIARGGSVLVPAFAVDRTELVLQALSDMVATGAIPTVPVYVDSPMALAALEVYRRGSLREELRDDVEPDFVQLPMLRAARSPEESMALNSPRTPCIIISASGMATGGRVVHHLRHMLPDRQNTVVLTGYQAVGTRGRSLLEGARELKMFGRYVPVEAEIVADEEFSVHADAEEVLSWLAQMPQRPETVYVVHGERGASEALAGRIRAELGWTVAVPYLGERVRLA